MYKVVSMFCGCGGSDRGMLGDFTYNGIYYEKLPFSIAFATDKDAKALKTYKTNIDCKNVICKDARNLRVEEVPDHDVLIGSFPCQPFSSLNTSKNPLNDQANLYKRMVKVVRHKQPKVFVTENVPGLLKPHNKVMLKKIYRSFRDCGYKLTYKILNAADYGVPQMRERIIIVGLRKDLNTKFKFPEGKYKNKRVPMSIAIPDINIDDKKYYFSEKAVEGLKRAQLNCPKTLKKGQWQDLNEPCRTITTQLNKLNATNPVLLVDSELDVYRRLTLQEAARIQSFPEDFKFTGSETSIYAQIGNAVPPVLFWNISNSIVNILRSCLD